MVGWQDIVPDFLHEPEPGQGGDQTKCLVADPEKLAGILFVWSVDLYSDLLDAV